MGSVWSRARQGVDPDEWGRRHEWDPVRRTAWTKVLYSFGRAEDLGRAAIERLIGALTLTRLLGKDGSRGHAVAGMYGSQVCSTPQACASTPSTPLGYCATTASATDPTHSTAMGRPSIGIAHVAHVTPRLRAPCARTQWVAGDTALASESAFGIGAGPRVLLTKTHQP